MTRRHGLPRTARLLSGRQFKAVFAGRLSCGNRFFRIFHQPSDQPRIGLAVSRRVAPRAVDRNRIRRCIRETFRLRRARLEPRDYVVTARPAAAGESRSTLARALDELWQRFEDQS
ncbi:MAG TPA: ribonuclease P protein component [Wenzhouxiangella sp.]|nr:ribonuclease P protein component [Wenzhouxiangella sp.]